MVQFNSRAWARMQTVASQVQPSSRVSPTYPNHALSGEATVCVTGAAGFVGSWLVTLCLQRGYRVRACVRSVDNDKKVGFLKSMPAYKDGRLSLHSADMTVPGAYDQVFEGCSTVFHPAEVFMSFGSGRGQVEAGILHADRGRLIEAGILHAAAIATAQNVVDSINRSSSVTRLVYTSSIAAMVSASLGRNPIVDESGDPDGDLNTYGPTKRLTEKFFSYSAYASGGKWSVVIGNPGDIVGPILSPHHAKETWQGHVGIIIQGTPSPQQPGGRPWFLSDVRDVAEAEIRLAESKTLKSGERYLLTSGDVVPQESLGSRAMEFFPKWDCATTVAPMPGAQTAMPSHPVFYRLQLRNDKIRHEVGMDFRSFQDTFKEMLDSLISVGGIRPRLKK